MKKHQMGWQWLSKQRLHRRALGLVLFAGMLTGMGIIGPQSEAAVLTCPSLHKISQIYLNQHITYNQPSHVLEKRTVEQYVKRIDVAKIYLRQSDIALIESRLLKGIFLKVKKNQCGALEEVQRLLVKRVQERVEFAKSTLSKKNFKFEPKTELQLDPDQRKFPVTATEADAFQSKYLQFQLSNYLATGMKQKEAQGHVIRNYERILRRVKETATEDLYSSYLDSFARSLDPHSSYFSKDVMEDFEISMALSLEGIGATLSSQDGFTVIEQLIEGGSAKRSNQLQTQDKILAVGQFDKSKDANDLGDMENVVEMDLRDVVRKIRGPKGSKVRLLILRKNTDGKSEKFTVDLVRDKIKLEDEAASLTYMERPVNGEKKKVAIVQLPSFYSDAKRGGRSSAKDVKLLLRKAKSEGAEALVLDLSQNGGGSLDDAVNITGLFFKSGNVVKQSSRDPSQPEMALMDRDPSVDWQGPMVVLTSRISASASEIVAGTLKDYSRAVIVGGDHTFGKGTVQSVVQIPVPGLGAVKVTVGMFYTAGGYSTQHRGVEADVVLPGAFSIDEVGEKSLDYSLPPTKIKSFLSPEAYATNGAGAWKRIDQNVMLQLKMRSQERVAKDPDFQKIVSDLAKAEKDGKGRVVKLAEALKETKEKKDEADQKKNMSKEEKADEYAKRAELAEAVNVVADLLALQTGVALTIGSSRPLPKVPMADGSINHPLPQGGGTRASDSP